MLHNTFRYISIQYFLFRCIFSFILLFILTLPFPYNTIPDVGNAGCIPFQPLVNYTAENIFHIHTPYTAEIISDSTGMYVQTFLHIIFSVCIAIVWTLLQKRNYRIVKLNYFFQIGCAYYLSLQLFKYGFDKLFKYQFYLPEPNTLYTNVGDLSKDILYWSTMGSSYSYSVFLGLTEIIPAILLLFRKTRTVGAMIAFAVLINVVMINFSFDISVKVYSSFLLLLSFIISLPGFKKIYYVFLKNQWRKESSLVLFNTPKKIMIHAAVKAMLIGIIILESFIGYVKTGIYNDDEAPRPLLHGAWKVAQHVYKNDTLNCTDKNYIKNIFIHRKGYFIIENKKGEMKDYKLSYNSENKNLLLTDYDNSTINFHYENKGDSLFLKNETMNIKVQKMNLKESPLLQNDFHWTIDEY
jgi:hypothetical protein